MENQNSQGKPCQAGRNGNLPPGARGIGRPRGSQNKITRTLKEAIEEVFERLGGVDALEEWASVPKNRTLFYCHLCAKLLPKKIEEVGNKGRGYTLVIHDPAEVIARARAEGRLPPEGEGEPPTNPSPVPIV